MKSPKITILMSVYNGEKYLREAIDSILNQTFKDFEFLIINDGSTDRTVEILRSYHDSRIKIITNEKNMGLTKSLNKGLKIARSEYVARMDADDISYPRRLEVQYEYMKKNPDVGIVGSWNDVIDDKGNTIDYRKHSLSSEDIY
ncbi:MAG: glycosyltransferase, partial [Candidatus Methylarchaceae archaeon HK01B]|nr:glycosyltransferase [Candidatus Methylarchaceae archaeon HK01B]